MTIAGALPRPGLARFAGQAERRIVRVDARTSVRVEIDRPEGPASKRGVVLLHGLAGSSEAGYVRGTAWKARRAGFLVARMNSRSCGDTEELTTAQYNGGDTDDLEAVARHLVENEGLEAVHLVGFSIGANIALRLASEWGDRPPSWASGLTVVSPCIDFAASTAALDEGLFGRFVQRRFLRELKEIMRRRHALDGGATDIRNLEAITTIREFDDRYTGPLSGYRGVEDYYERAGMVGRLHRVALPTLLIASRDDPLVPPACFDELRAGEHASIRCLLTDRGGHVAFVARRAARTDGWTDLDRYWAENRAIQFAAACASG